MLFLEIEFILFMYWEFYDLLFYSCFWIGRYNNLIGSIMRFFGKIEFLFIVKLLMSDKVIKLV